MEIKIRNVTSFFRTYYIVVYTQARVFRIPLYWKRFGNLLKSFLPVNIQIDSVVSCTIQESEHGDGLHKNEVNIIATTNLSPVSMDYLPNVRKF